MRDGACRDGLQGDGDDAQSACVATLFAFAEHQTHSASAGKRSEKVVTCRDPRHNCNSPVPRQRPSTACFGVRQTGGGRATAL